MDIIANFQPFLEKWCKENHKPLPPEGTINKIWQLAWQDYLDTELTNNWESNRQDYLNMNLLTTAEVRRRKAQEELNKINAELAEQEIIEEPEQPVKSVWEQVQDMM